MWTRWIGRGSALGGSMLVAFVASPSIAAQTPIVTHFGDSAGDRLGRAVAGVGDLDGDDRPDFAAGAFQGDQGSNVDVGYVRAWSSGTGATLFTFYGDQPGERFGFSIGAAGDFDGDGVPDVVGGGIDRTVNGNVEAGCARVISGYDGALIAMFLGTQSVGRYGFGVNNAGDVDLDGRTDLAIGAPLEDGLKGTNCGIVYLIAGGTNALLRRYDGASPFEEFGRTMVSGDFDGNGGADLAVGSWHADQGGTDAGSTYLFAGSNGALLRLYSGDTPFDFFGIAIDNVFDLDTDGRDDVIVGSHHDDPFGIESGSARVFSTLAGNLLFKFDGEVPDMYFGRSVAGVGDLDGDQVPDLEAGTPFLDNALSQNHGLARIYSGRSGQLLYQVNEDSVNDLFAFAVAGVGDADANGYTDFVIGARDDDDVASNSGSVRLYNGCSGEKVEGGGGSAGTGSFVPRLRLEGCPRVGSTVTMRLDRALGGATAFVVLAPTLGETPLPSGEVLKVVLPVVGFLPIQLAGTGSGQGFITMEATLSASDLGAGVAIQAIVLDPAGVGGIALSNAIQFTVN